MLFTDLSVMEILYRDLKQSCVTQSPSLYTRETLSSWFPTVGYIIVHAIQCVWVALNYVLCLDVPFIPIELCMKIVIKDDVTIT